ncbi:MAG TPA: tetratricopeptide repeat protein [Terriglobia bacterium]|nr:tetratricopeptide repeat protein [Terriglobia bacterium]
MAFDKAKALQEANKYVTQGKIAKAIKQYEWVVENEPSDLTLLNVIGDLYARENNAQEALKYFYNLADAYMREGYKLKAIAIYRKIVKLDQDRVEPLIRLAELSSAQGLAREAREHFKGALDLFERKGQHEQALDVARKLCRLDPGNHVLRLELAQVSERAGKGREAVEAYLGAAVLARDNGNLAACRAGLDRAAKLDPDNTEVRLLRARQALMDDKPQDLAEILGSLPALQNSPEAKRLLFESHMATNNLDAASGILIDVVESNPSNFAPVAYFIDRCAQKGEHDAASQVLKRVTPVLLARRETTPLMAALLGFWKSNPERTDVLELMYEVAEKAADEAAISEVLQAVGDAFLQSGHLENAQHAYSRLVAREPENERFKDLLRTVLEKQGRGSAPLSQSLLMSANTGINSDAVSSQFGSGEGTSPQAAQVATTDGGSPALRETDLAPPFAESHLPAQPVEFNLSQTGDVEDAAAEESELPPPSEIPVDFQSLHRNESSTAGSGIPPADSSAAMSPQQSPEEQPQPSNLPTFNFEESREEIEFYLRHGFYDEAHKAVAEFEKNYPAESQVPELRRRLDRAAHVSSAMPLPKAAPPTNDQDRDQAKWDLPTCFFDSASAANRVRESHSPAAFTVDGSKHEPAKNPRAAANSTVEAPYDAAKSPASPASQAGRDRGPAASDDALAELASLLNEFADTREPVDQAADDEQTHYNLGVAFREMGLLDEAIGEFQKVVSATSTKVYGPRFLQVCTLLASCFMDKEMPAIAAKWYSRALDAPGLDYVGTLALCYDLGIAFEKAGNTTAALENFTEVYSQNIDYRDVAEKIRLLRQTSR